MQYTTIVAMLQIFFNYLGTIVMNVPEIQRLIDYINENYKSRSEFARKIGISPSHLRTYIDRNKPPGGVFLKRLTDAGVDINYIMKGETATNVVKEPPMIFGVAAGHFTPTFDDIQETYDTSFLSKPGVVAAKVIGDSMEKAGLEPDDVVIVDTLVDRDYGDILLTRDGMGYTLKRLTPNGLEPESNNKYPILPIEKAYQAVGVVTHIIKKVKPKRFKNTEKTR